MINYCRRDVFPDELVAGAIPFVDHPLKIAAEMVETVVFVVRDGPASGNHRQFFPPDLTGHRLRNLLVRDGADDDIVGLLNVKIEHIHVEYPHLFAGEPPPYELIEALVDFHDVEGVAR